VLALGAASAQRAVPVIVLDKAAREISEPFTRIAGTVELRDGRVLVSDSQEKEIWLVDFKGDSRTQVARSGGGPTEIQAGALLAGASDSAVYNDLQQRRLLVFSPAGVPVATRSSGGDRTDPIAALTAMQLRYVDASGRLFGQTTGVNMPSMSSIEASTNPAAVMPTFADSVQIQRLDPGTGMTDTIARIRNMTVAAAPKMEMVGGAMKFTMRAPDMRPVDVWTGLPDGRVAILRDGIYRVQFVRPGGAVTQGPPIPHKPIPLTADEKRAAMDSIRAALARMNQQIGRAMANAGASAAKAPKMDFEVLEPVSWAATKPAYIGMSASPDGRLWVNTPLPFTDKSSQYDVLDGAGALIARVRVPSGETVVGFGRGFLYTTRLDADDLMYLRRYALPAPLGTGR
jgi:hypothetical protein